MIFKRGKDMKKFAVVCKNLDSPIMKKAAEVLSEFLLDYTFECPIFVNDKKEINKEIYRCIYIGTKENNEYIKSKSLTKLTQPEEYYIKVENEDVIIEGFDEAGVLYGCVDFYNKYIVKNEFPDNDKYRVNFFEEDIIPDFEYTSKPAVKNRGIWTWGYVIYDYRKFIDNMVKLKMNHIVIWNDFIPVNASEMVEYAHNCGIKVIWGYAWGWGVDCSKELPSDLNKASKEIFEKYEREYAKLGGDGIYFQSFTELKTQTIGGKLIAEVVSSFVNQTSALFFEKYPNIELQFGLHATSVNENLKYIATVDPRIRIVWEDCGAFPYSYIPNDTENINETIDFVNKIAVLRGDNDKFGVVTKGLTKLDWYSFEHLQGAVCVGASSKYMKANRVERKRKIWKYLQACWLTNADKAYAAIKAISDIKDGDLYVTPLIEDGMFEENIMYPAALCAEMLWDCETPLNKMMTDVALRDYVEFA